MSIPKSYSNNPKTQHKPNPNQNPQSNPKAPKQGLFGNFLVDDPKEDKKMQEEIKKKYPFNLPKKDLDLDDPSPGLIRENLGLQYFRSKFGKKLPRQYFTYTDRKRINRRQYIAHSKNFHHILLFPNDDYIGIKMYDLRSKVFIGKPYKIRRTSESTKSKSGLCI